MPMQTGTSKLMSKYGAKLDAAAKAHASDPVDYGNQRLPPGINNGIAKLVECKFDEYKAGPNKGEYYFRAAGVVVEPRSVMVDGQQIEVFGQQTSIMLPVCDTKTADGKVTTQEEHIAEIWNEMKKLGLDAEGLGGADLEPSAAALKEAGPYFRFSTSKRVGREYFDTKTKTKKMGADGVWENWYGNKGVEDYQPPENGQVVDETGEPLAEGENGQPTEPDANPEGFTDLEQLVAVANGTNADAGAAQAKLRQMALDAGCDEAEVDSAADWPAVAAMIEAAGQAAEENAPVEPEPEAAAPSIPEKGAVVSYKLLDPKTGKPLTDLDKKTKKQVERKPAQCEVLTVDPKSQTVTLKNLENGKVLISADKKPLKVKWDDLLAD